MLVVAIAVLGFRSKCVRHMPCPSFDGYFAILFQNRLFDMLGFDYASARYFVVFECDVLLSTIVTFVSYSLSKSKYDRYSRNEE